MSYKFCPSKRIPCFLYLLLLTTMTVTSCRKEKEGHGSVSGSVHPYDGAISFSLHDPVTGEQRYTTAPNGSGEFVFTDLVEGEYILRVKQTPLLNPHEGVTVSVLAYQHTEVPMIFLVYDDDAQKGSIDFTLDGSSQYIGPKSLSLTNTPFQFVLSGTFFAGPVKHYLSIILSDASDTGTYPMWEGHQINVAEFASNGDFVRSWSALNDSTGLTTITVYNPTTRNVSGTFNATLVPNDSLGGPSRKVNGSFTNILY